MKPEKRKLPPPKQGKGAKKRKLVHNKRARLQNLSDDSSEDESLRERLAKKKPSETRPQIRL